VASPALKLIIIIIATPNNHNLHSTINEKLQKHKNSKEEPVRIRKMKTACAIPLALFKRQYYFTQITLAFTLAKNATKPNTFEIISLKTTRKENNWKTEEKLARAGVTLEKERIKWSSP